MSLKLNLLRGSAVEARTQDEAQDSSGEGDDEILQQKLQAFKSSGNKLSAKIIGNERTSEKKHKVIYYRLQVLTNRQSYTIDKRYNDFKALHDRLTAREEAYTFKDFPANRSYVTYSILFFFPGRLVFIKAKHSSAGLIRKTSKQTEKFSNMLTFLTDNYSKFEYVDFLCWLEIDHHVIRQMMPPKKPHNKAASGSFSMISSFIDSEKTSELRNLLMDLERGSDAKPCLDQIQRFVFESKTAPLIR